MKVAVLSGKGGSGKTLFAVNLAAVSKKGLYIDCDVEEPNGHLFFKPIISSRKEIYVKTPVIDATLCNQCRRCVDFCRFNAMASIGEHIKVFDEVCHSCGGCQLLCPQNAIQEKERGIGSVTLGRSKQVKVLTGMMHQGETSGVPIIDALLDMAKTFEDKEEQGIDQIIDCPPGSACTVMESIKTADYCLLVAEPTVFGLHNLQMVWSLVSLFEIPYGIVLNRTFGSDNPIVNFARDNDIPIMGELPYDQWLAKVNSDGEIVSDVSEAYRAFFEALLTKIKGAVKNEAVVDSKW